MQEYDRPVAVSGKVSEKTLQPRRNAADVFLRAVVRKRDLRGGQLFASSELFHQIAAPRRILCATRDAKSGLEWAEPEQTRSNRA